ncbi:MAG: hypothetical protein ACM3VS_18385 [Candidatus Dadabacteria bacterium]
MKKVLVLVAFLTTVCITNSFAQGGPGGGDPAAMAARYKERVKPQLIEKTKLTDAQAEKVLDIQLASRQQMRGLRDLTPEEREKKLAEFQAEQEKQYKAIPLTDEQVKAVTDFFVEMRKQMQQRQGGNGGNR